MKSASSLLLSLLLTVPVMLAAQAERQSASSSMNEPELSLILEPGPAVDGMPITFVFICVMSGKRIFGYHSRT